MTRGRPVELDQSTEADQAPAGATAAGETAPEAPPAPTHTGTHDDGTHDDHLSPDGTDLTAVLALLRELVVASGEYHVRAAQREHVIDLLHDDVERLRAGERRGLLRPLLVDLCRLRNDLLRQAETLPEDFTAEQARVLLRSYAQSMELTLGNGGVTPYAPEPGQPFDFRLHRRVGTVDTGDADLAGRVGRVRADGYTDTETDRPMAPAEVLLYTLRGPSPRETAPENTAPEDTVTTDRG
jgi:molecular chaperone GrpE (heat shock protein)